MANDMRSSSAGRGSANNTRSSSPKGDSANNARSSSAKGDSANNARSSSATGDSANNTRSSSAERDSANKMWGGRFETKPSEIMEEINASISFDRRFYAEDIRASQAHANMLCACGILSDEEAEAIVSGLDAVRAEIEGGRFEFRREYEDIHMAVEARLKDLIGPVAGKLHTARSRNDQVATDFRLYIRGAIDHLDSQIAGLQLALARKAEAHAGTLMPGFTHMQTAQPVTFGHHCLAYVEMLARDRGRFAGARMRVNKSPLGAAALAGTSFPIDRHMTADELGFERPMANSLDAVSARDFALENSRRRLDLRGASLAACRGDRDLVQRRLRLYQAVGPLHHRLVDHAAEAEPGCRRACAREGWAHRRGIRRAAYRDEGPAARLLQGYAGGQGGSVLGHRRAVARASRP